MLYGKVFERFLDRNDESLYTSLSAGNPIRNNLSHWPVVPGIPKIISSQLGKLLSLVQLW